jgi:hypothetical protein
MNDPLKELFIEACGGHAGVRDRRAVGGWALSDEDLGKYAASIVRECAKFLEDNSGYDDCNNAWHPEPEDLLNHFGVSE